MMQKALAERQELFCVWHIEKQIFIYCREVMIYEKDLFEKIILRYYLHCACDGRSAARECKRHGAAAIL
jgi:hypothetical protein